MSGLDLTPSARRVVVRIEGCRVEIGQRRTVRVVLALHDCPRTRAKRVPEQDSNEDQDEEPEWPDHEQQQNRDDQENKRASQGDGVNGHTIRSSAMRSEGNGSGIAARPTPYEK